MATNINDVIAVSEIEANINKVIVAIEKLEGKITEANEKVLTVQVDANAVQTMTELTTAYKQFSEAAKQSNSVLNESKPVIEGVNTLTENFGANIAQNAEKLAEQRINLKRVQEDLKVFQAGAKDAGQQSGEFSEELAILTQRELELKIAVGATTMALKSQIKETIATVGSIDEMTQTLGQLRERYRALSQAERENVEVGVKLNAEIAELDLKVKQLNASIGNFHGNVGNYASGFKTVGAELSHVKEQMRLLVLAGQKNSAEFRTLAARGQELQKSMTAVGRETKEALFSIEHVSNRVATMMFRMALHMIVFTVIIGAITKVIELFSQLSEAEQDAADRLKEYNDEGKKLKQTLKDINLATEITSSKEKSQNALIINTLLAKNTTLAAQKKLYEELQSKYSDFLPKLTEEQKKQKDGILLTNQQITAIKALSEIVDKKAAVKTKTEALDGLLEQEKKANDVMRRIADVARYQHTTKDRVLGNKDALKENIDYFVANGGREQWTEKDGMVLRNKLTHKGDEKNFDEYIKAYREVNGFNITKSGTPYQGFPNQTKGNDVPGLKDKIKELTAARQADNESIAQHLIFEEKEKKAKGPNEKGYLSAIESEKARYKDEVAEYKALRLKQSDIGEAGAMYDEQLRLKERNATIHHKFELNKIEADWIGKDGQLKERHLANMKMYEAEMKDAVVRNDEVGKKAAKDKIDRELALMKLQDEAAEHAREHMAKMLQLEREAAAAKASAKSSREASQGVTPFLSALGFDGDYKEQQKQFELQKQAKAAEIRDKENQLNAETHRAGNTIEGMPDPKKMDALMEEIAKKKNEAQDLEYEQQKAHDDRLIEAKKRIGEETIELVRQTAASIKQIEDQKFAAEQQRLAYEMERTQLQSKQKIEAIDATAGFQITKDNQKAVVAAQTAAKENEIQQKQNQLALKKAISDKKMAEMGILVNTALAEIKVIATAPNFVIGAAEAVLVAAIGAAQYAAAANAPLPQFFEGGITETPIIRAGEQGRELGRTPQGDTLLFNKDAAYHVPIGTEIFNNAESERMIRYAVNNMGVLEVQKVEAQGNNWKGENLLDELKEINSNLIYSVMAKPQKPTVIVINQQNYLQRPTKR